METVKRYALSSANTFISAAILGIAADIVTVGHVELTVPFCLGVLLVGLRAGVKALAESIVGRHAD